MSIELASPNARARPAPHQSGARTNRAAARLRRRIHVLVIDEQGIIRDAVCALLEGMPEIARVSSISTGPEALLAAASLQPDVIIIEFPKPQETGATLIAALKRQRPETRVLVLTFHSQGHLIEAALRAGADGYLLKGDSLTELTNALQTVLAGKIYLSATISGRVIRGVWRSADVADKRRGDASEITHRERQVIRLIASGYRSREIAKLLSLSHKTVDKHRASVMRKFGLRNASAVAAYAVAHGIVDD